MEHVHLAAEEDDLYSGYNDYNPTFDSEVAIASLVFSFELEYYLIFTLVLYWICD